MHNLTQLKFDTGKKGIGILPMALILMGVGIFFCVGLLLYESETAEAFLYPYVLPWILFTFSIICLPLAIKFYKGDFNLFEPTVFASWSYFLPVFVFGGIVFSAGANQPYFVAFIDDPKINLPLTYFYLVIGIAGLLIGYHIPIGKKIGKYIGEKLPKSEWSAENIIFPAVILLVIGFWFNISGFLAGVLGFQRVTVIDAFDNVQYFLSLLVLESSFILWTYIFQAKEKNSKFYIILAVLVIIIPLRTMILGSRGGLFHSFILIAMAYVFSGRKLKAKQSVIFSTVLFAVIFIGMVYGTTFRNIRGAESRANAGEYVDSAFQTVDLISNTDIFVIGSEAMANLGERLENVSALAVIVSNYEKLAPYEASYGMENNIWTYTWTAFIPRFLWADKPIVSDARSYSELYFNFGENSFPMTTFGDLLRNFGPIGIPLGMMLLGIFLRVLYSSLIENQTFQIWRTTAYFMLLTRVSYEGFYGTIVPDFIRTIFLIIISFLLIKFLAKSRVK